jgi:hypothetical protein
MKAGEANSVGASGDERLRLAGEVTMISSSSMVGGLDVGRAVGWEGIPRLITDLDVAMSKFTRKVWWLKTSEEGTGRKVP